MSRPWAKWYFADWRGDPRLRMCGLPARGLWADILSYMHEGEPYGHFTIDGKVPQLPDIARLVGAPVREVRAAYDELQRHGVFSRNELGVPFSRRMLRDAERDKRDTENGKLGGNPKLRGGDNPPDKAQIPETRIPGDRNTEPSLDSVGFAPAKPKRGTRWDSSRIVGKDWLLDAIGARQLAGLPDADLELEARKFANYWASKSGASATKTDWYKTWENWALKAEGKSNGAGFMGRNRRSAGDTLRDLDAGNPEGPVHDG